MKATLAEAIELRKNNKPEEAMLILQALLQSDPGDPDINYQMAWTCDFMGKESEAVPFYEKAIANGLREGRSGAMLGLGSTYRCLGEYEKSLGVFNSALTEFPDNRSLKVFRALTLYNLGQTEESVSQLLVQLLDTTKDESIKSYAVDNRLLFRDKKTLTFSARYHPCERASFCSSSLTELLALEVRTRTRHALFN